MALLSVILSMAAWWNVQQNTRLTLLEERHAALAKSVYEHAILNETFKKNDLMLQALQQEFRVAIERLNGSAATAQEIKLLVQALETQHRTLRDTVLRMEQAILAVLEPLQQRQGR
jgi:spore germination cell wall hydrolase CwlJ-like protein